MEGMYAAQECGRAANLCQNLEEAVSADKVKDLSQIDESNVLRFPLLSTLLLQLSQ